MTYNSKAQISQDIHKKTLTREWRQTETYHYRLPSMLQPSGTDCSMSLVFMLRSRQYQSHDKTREQTYVDVHRYKWREFVQTHNNPPDWHNFSTHKPRYKPEATRPVQFIVIQATESTQYDTRATDNTIHKSTAFKSTWAVPARGKYGQSSASGARPEQGSLTHKVY